MNKKTKAKEKVLAYGEATGHAHRVDVDVYASGETREFDGSTLIRHEEHKAVEIPDGKWTSGQVREFDPLTRMVSPVVD